MMVSFKYSTSGAYLGNILMYSPKLYQFNLISYDSNPTTQVTARDQAACLSLEA